MLWTLMILVLLFWLVGFAFDVVGGLIHLLLIIAAVLFLVQIMSGKKVRI